MLSDRATKRSTFARRAISHPATFWDIETNLQGYVFRLHNTVPLTQAVGTTIDAGAGSILIENGAAFDQRGTLITRSAGSGEIQIQASGTISVGTINAPNTDVMLTSGGGISLPQSSMLAGRNIVLASNGAVTQTGTLSVAASAFVIDTTGRNAPVLRSDLVNASGSGPTTANPHPVVTDPRVITNPRFAPAGAHRGSVRRSTQSNG